jgi:hypothetical protein
MKSFKISLILFSFLMFVSASYSQSDKKKIKTFIKEGDANFAIEDYYNGLLEYNKVLALDSKHDKANVYATICKVRLGYAADSCVTNIERLQTSMYPDARYYLAKIKHKQKNVDEAIALLNTYILTPKKKRLHTDEETDYFLNVCKSAKNLVAKPHRSIIKNIGKSINSTAADYVPVVVPDESAMYFTSRRSGSSNNVKDEVGVFKEDVYVSYKDGDVWQTAQNMGEPINTENNDACVAISPDGQRMIIYRTAADKVSGDLYLTTAGSNNKWTEPQLMGKEINSQFIETSACFSNDTSEFYFSSNRPGGYGGKDIYRIKKLPNGRWALPFNLGPNINTLYDEDAPFLHPDGITLYFSSKGHSTMGEYDVFKSLINEETNQFNKPENLGYPINSVGNDIFFVLNVDGQKGYYSSVKEDTYGSSDIYEIDTRFGDNDLKVKKCWLMKGDKMGKAKITLLDNETNKVSGIYLSNPATGKFILVMNPLKSYKAIVQEEGYQNLVVEIEPLAFEKIDKDLEFKLIKK